ncbi:hypothetical protein LTR37_012107 [Vermiconidia calcicola]|uniref:Uncharacterized protein n=1 Tax=Vermiconidia calcicola TaxID=1690605 RepID=A0ACC3N040_9PEZI|nr:hypothetical protein LTR37_012107 [Vermiconidia calcicola]
MVISISATRRLLALVATLLLTNALGCYSGGLAFEDLHGGADSNDLGIEAEVLADISNVCNEVNGAVFKNGDPPSTHCSDWTVTVEPDDTCYDVCLLGGGLDCDPDCGGPVHFNFLGETSDVTPLNTGYYASLTDDQLAKVRSDCQVHFVEDDTSGPRPEEEITVDDSDESAGTLARRGQQKEAPWPLFEMSAATTVALPPPDESYYYVDNPGEGVDVYIIDSGINHPYDEFNDDGRSDRIVDEINVSTEPDDYSDVAPNAGHGTLIADAVGGNGYSVAKSATLRNVKYERNRVPDAARFVQAMQQVILKHNARKTESGFKGSIINMSFSLGKTLSAAKELENAYKAGISLVTSAGNRKYNARSFPAIDEHVISVGGSSNDYTPWQEAEAGSNYGEGILDLWAPGQRVPLTDKDGRSTTATGTSFASGYVSGILAIFYGVEGTSMNLDLARERLIAQTDDWITLPDGTDWHNSPKAFANTGNRKGAAQFPPVVYIGGPEV